MRVAILLSGLLILTACSGREKAVSAQAPAASPVVDSYRSWVIQQADELLSSTETFVQAVLDGKREQAQDLYAPSRAPYERIEPVAEALGDLDPRIDAREGDVADADFRGFHRLEKALWTNEPLSNVRDTAVTLRDDVRRLRALLETVTLTENELVTGAVELLNEVSTSKVTGEEDRYSHTDLSDFAANVDGAAEIWSLLSARVAARDQSLSSTVGKAGSFSTSKTCTWLASARKTSKCRFSISKTSPLRGTRPR